MSQEIVLTKEEKNLILERRKNEEREQCKIVSVGTLKQDTCYTHVLEERIISSLDDLCENTSVTRESFLEYIENLNKIFDNFMIKKGTQFYCTRSEYGEFWGESKFYFNLDTKWAEENLENIRDY